MKTSDYGHFGRASNVRDTADDAPPADAVACLIAALPAPRRPLPPAAEVIDLETRRGR